MNIRLVSIVFFLLTFLGNNSLSASKSYKGRILKNDKQNGNKIQGKAANNTKITKISKQSPASKEVHQLVEDMEDDIKALVSSRSRLIFEPFEAISFTSQTTNLDDKKKNYDTIGKGTHFFVKIKALVEVNDMEEVQYFHFRIFQPTNKDPDEVKVIGIDGKIVDEVNVVNIKKLEDPIKPMGIFDNWTGVDDPLDLPRVQFYNPSLDMAEY